MWFRWCASRRPRLSQEGDAEGGITPTRAGGGARGGGPTQEDHVPPPPLRKSHHHGYSEPYDLPHHSNRRVHCQRWLMVDCIANLAGVCPSQRVWSLPHPNTAQERWRWVVPPPTAPLWGV